MSGLASYPRAGGLPLLGLQQLQAAIQDLQNNQIHLDIAARQALACLKGLVASGAAAQDVVHHARSVRHAMMVAKLIDSSIGKELKETMVICAKHWMALHPIDKSGFQVRAAAAINDYLNAKASMSQVKMRIASELAGTISALYHISGLLGEDYSGMAFNQAATVGNSKFRSVVGKNGTLAFLECGASYNVNIFLQLPVKNSSFVIVAEAKGGASGFGEVKGPAAMTMATGILTPISQKDPRYVESRAYYMKGDVSGTAQGQLRRQAGIAIERAFALETFAYVAARGEVVNGNLQTTREVFECL